MIYLTNRLGYSDNDATILYHGFTMLVYLMCIIGGVISDVWLGKFRTIFILSIVYAIGTLTVSVSAIPTINLPPKQALLIGLVSSSHNRISQQRKPHFHHKLIIPFNSCTHRPLLLSVPVVLNHAFRRLVAINLNFPSKLRNSLRSFHYFISP